MTGLSLWEKMGAPPGRPKLRRFCEQVEAGETPDKETLEWLSQAFRKMLTEGDPKKKPAVLMRALGMNWRRGKKPPKESEEAPRYEAAVRVFLLDPNGENQPQAIGTVADELDCDESTVYRWVKKHRASAQPFAKWILSVEKRRGR